MRTLLIATTALAVGFALPALAANGSYDQQQGYNQNQGYSAPGYQSQNDQAMGNQGSGYQGQGFQGQTGQNMVEQRYPGGNSSSGWSNRPSSESQGMNNQANSGSWNSGRNSNSGMNSNFGTSSNSGAGSQAENNQGMNQRADHLRQRIRDDLAQGGFTDIHIIPRSFVVIARDPQGNPVQLMITPNSVAEMTQIPMPGRMARNGDRDEYRSGGNSAWNNSAGSSDNSSSAMQGSSGSSTGVTR